MAQSILRFWAIRLRPYCPKSSDVHAIATIEVAFAVQAGLVDPKNSKRIVKLRVQLCMIGAIQKCLSHKEEIDKKWEEDQLRVAQGKDNE